MRLDATVTRSLIDPFEDQVRIYPTTSHTFSQRYILDARTVEERSDYWCSMTAGGPPREVSRQRLRPVQGRAVTAENGSVLAEPVTAGQRLCRPPAGPVEMITTSPLRRGARKPRHRRWSDPPNFRYCRYA